MSGIVAAYAYLGERVPQIAKRESRHRPAWTIADLEAVTLLLDAPARREQIALARIEGTARFVSKYGQDETNALEAVRIIARQALGLS